MTEDTDRKRRERQARYAAMSDAELVTGIQLDDRFAVDEFIARFHRLLLNRAWRVGIRRELCDETIIMLLERVIAAIAIGRLKIHTSVSAYLVQAFQREYAKVERSRRARARLLRENAADYVGTGEVAMMGLISEYSVQASRGPGWEPQPLPLAVERLASMIDEELTEEHQRFVLYVANEVSIRDLAAEFDLTYEVLAKRITRLREKMREAALRHAEQFRLEDRAYLATFFNRANRLYEAAVLAASVLRERARKAEEAQTQDGTGEDQ